MTEQLMQMAANLTRAGRLPEAVEVYGRILAGEPRNLAALGRLGLLHFHARQFDEAEQVLAKAEEVQPDLADLICVRGVALVELSRLPEAIACFDRALACRPGFIDAMINRATAMLTVERYDEALEGLREVIDKQPRLAPAWNNLGNVYVKLGKIEEAVSAYKTALEIHPGFAEAARALSVAEAALSGMRAAVAAADAALAAEPAVPANWMRRGELHASAQEFEPAAECFTRALEFDPDFPAAFAARESAIFELRKSSRCPPAYVVTLFDAAAATYDELLVGSLNYQGHVQLRAFADEVLPKREPPAWRILELGCGTGLVGEEFKDLKNGGRLDAIDLSPKMLEAAAKRGLYDELILGDIETVLLGEGPSYNLILASDTMEYFGDLQPALAGVADRLEAGGYFLFGVERKQGDGWDLPNTRRYRHSESYVREVAGRAGFEVVKVAARVMRHEKTLPVDSLVLALRKP